MTRTPIATIALIGACLAGAATGSELSEPNVALRGSLDNARITFEQTGQGHVAFMGGSITEMNGYRPMVMELLQRRFPKTEFTFTDAGISSTCSTTGAFRLEEHVLSQGPVDLFFVEFAVNDDQDAAHQRRTCIRGMEGILRRLRQHNPAADVVITYFVNPSMLETLQQGKVPVSIGAHDAVARHYGVSTIHLAREVAEQITAGTFTWEKFGGTHPKPPGNALCTAMIEQLLTEAWVEPLSQDAARRPHPLPDEPLDGNHYGRGRFVEPDAVQLGAGFSVHVPDWKSLPGQCRGRFVDVPMTCATEPGAELTLSFTGTAVGAYVLAGPDAGVVEAVVDGGQPKPFDLYHRFSANLHYPRTVVFEADLEAGQHTLTLRVAESKNAAGRGHAVRVVRFVAN